MDQHRETYREEARELLSELETALLKLEETPDDRDLIGRVFRAMHTIKGSGAMFGFDDIAAFTHEIETVFDKVREGQIPVTNDLVSLTLKACDQIGKMVEGDRTDEAEKGKILTAFREKLPDAGGAGKTGAGKSGTGPPAGKQEDPNVTYRIRFRPGKDLFATGTNPIPLLDELRALGPHRVTARTDVIPPLSEMEPEACYLYWDVTLSTSRGIDAVKDVFIFVEDSCELKIEAVDEEEEIAPEKAEGYKRLGEILVERGDLRTEDLNEALESRKRIGEVLAERGAVSKEAVKSAMEEQQHVAEARQMRQEKAAASSIRVAANKLDALVDMVGELVTVQARLSQKASTQADADLLSISEEVERLTAELRDTTMGIRMLPIGTVFSKFTRLVRDLSGELGKKIVMTTEGAETELDKTVIERLNDPLVHLIRNSIDHGIELPAERLEKGKKSQGTVHLAAYHSGANVFIRIQDDGAGLDRERIREKAVERGLIASDAVLADREIFDLIFLPGFSTSRTVSNVSGRGVGMDVVKRGIAALQGSIETASTKGEGTTITLKLPLTLAIIDGLLVRIGQAHFVLPLSAIDECVELTRQDVANANGQHLATIRGELVPYLRLRQRFGIAGEPPAIEQIITTQIDGHRVGLVVDQVVGEHQTVIKSLGRFYRGVEEVSGATILGDGNVALILDLPKLVHKAEMEEKAKNSHGRAG